jgi:4-alpha-glucanotransferase
VSGAALQALAEALGILPEWHDLAGTRHVPQPETQRELLAAMGLAVGSEAEAAEVLAARTAEAAARRLPEEVVATAGEETRVPLADAARWRLLQEDGAQQEGQAEGAIFFTAPPGLHRLVVESDGREDSCLVIAAPERAPTVREAPGRVRGWGTTAALYALRGPQNFGLGTYADLGTAARQLAELGADFLGINPVHARGAACAGISPYTPSCRTAFEPRHIAVDQVPGFAASARAQAVLQENAGRLAAARRAELVDYATANAVTEEALRALFADVEERGGRSVEDFTRWRRGEGEKLEWFALFEAISLTHGADWRDWPEELQRFGGAAVLDFAAGNAAEVRYHAWLQWLAATQLAAAQQRARGAGMGLGLYLDVAVGVRPGGADSWAAPDCFAEGVSLGAPPDAFNPAGQNWCLAPFNPVGLRRATYRPFIEMLRTAMRHAGIIRIDHILGVKRSFWVPADGAPGGYVAYPQEALLALIRLEAWRAGCVVVGEDLGSVPPGLRDRLAEAGLLGCAVVQFEKEHHRFRPTREYRPATLASFGTHDTPTLRGWWSGWDIDRRHDITNGLGGNDAAARAADHEARAAERRGLARLLQDEGLAPEGFDPAAPPAELDDGVAAALHRLLARAGSVLVAVQLDDALGRVEQQNLPGTIDEHPNWRRRYAVAVDALAAHAGLRAIAAIFSPPESPTPSPQEHRPWQ